MDTEEHTYFRNLDLLGFILFLAFGTSCATVANLFLKDFKYEWTDFLKDINTYKTVGFVLATTLLPNVLSDIQVGHGHGERKKTRDRW